MAFTPFNPFPIQLQDGSGDNYSSAQLRFFISGTSTPTNMYSDNTGTSIGSSILLNASGYPESGGNTITLFRDTAVDLKVEFHANAGSSTAIWTADGLKDALSVLASTVNGEGASLVSIEDALANYTATDVEGVLAEIAADYLKDVVDDTTPQLGGELDAQGNVISDAEIKDYSMTNTTPTSASGAITFDMALGNHFDVLLTEDITTITISNPPASGKVGRIEVDFTQDGTGNWAVAWPAAVEFPGGTPPVITVAAGAKDTVTAKTKDAGTSYRADFSQAYS